MKVRGIVLLVASAAFISSGQAVADQPTDSMRTVNCTDVANMSIEEALKVGDFVEDGGSAAMVQKPGSSVTSDVLLENGSDSLTVRTEQDGSVVVENCGPDEIQSEQAEPTSTVSRTHRQTASISALGECSDTAYSLHGWRWYWTYLWYFKQDTTPEGLSGANVASALESATQSITGARNTCGMADNIPATQQYGGSTTTWANINLSGCLASDGVNLTDFAGGPGGVLAQTCTWENSPGTAGSSDTRFNDSLFDWMPDGSGTCGGRYVIRSVAAHERGHTFGIAHVGEGTHGNLTMSEVIGPCSDQEYWLGRGDVLGLRARYGV
ncbi:MAG: hypothetical protein ACJ75S_00085 [Solirubrobacterales bacterium]